MAGKKPHKPLTETQAVVAWLNYFYEQKLSPAAIETASARIAAREGRRPTLEELLALDKRGLIKLKRVKYTATDAEALIPALRALSDACPRCRISGTSRRTARTTPRGCAPTRRSTRTPRPASAR
jgi:hypothetical protein